MSSGKIRTFIAIEIPDELKARMREVAALIDCGFHGVTWPKPEVIHLTLKYLGEVDGDAVPRVIKALDGACAGIRPFTLVAEGVGAFPSMKSPRVVWIGVNEDVTLARLHENIKDGLAKAGVEREANPYKPHITLCRVRSIADSMEMSKSIQKAKPEVRFEFRVAAFALFKSVLTPNGSVHTQIARFELKQ